MATPFNVLITSISKKVPLIKAVLHSLQALVPKGKVIGADSNPQCVGRYFVDGFWRMPPQEKLTVKELAAYCQKHNIKAIIPSRDGELPFFAHHQAALKRHDIACLISPETAIDICRDKLSFCQFLLKHGFPAIPTTKDLNDLRSSAYVVKEQFGAGAKEIGLNLSKKEALAWSASLSAPIFQPYIRGEEYSIDLYVDRSGAVRGPIVRKRDLVVQGESQITTSLKYPRLEKLCADLAKTLKLYGHAVFQVICDREDNLHVVECNPRFGGASTLSLAMGLHSFKWFFSETLKQPLPPFIREKQEMRQVRYAADLIIPYQETASR